MLRLFVEWDIVFHCLKSRLLVHTNAASSAPIMVPKNPHQDFARRFHQWQNLLSTVYGSIATGSKVGVD
jgi:hypothetical protein